MSLDLTLCKNEYPNLFKGIGELIDKQINLHIDGNFKPTTQ